MKRPGWTLVVFAVALTALAFVFRSAPSHAAGAGVGSGQDYDALTAARFELSVVPLGLQGTEINIANERLANETVDDAVCRFAVTAYDAKGAMLFTTEQIVGPGETNRLDLGSRELQGESVFRVTVQVLDTDRSGRIRPCPALVSQRVYDRSLGTTEYYVPARTQ